MLQFDFHAIARIDRYKLLTGLVVPRPIALVTSLSKDGIVNAAPFSFFNVFAEDPGLVVLGTTNTPEFGKNASTEPLLHGPTRNPWRTTHSPGGSSGGSAAAVASGMVGDHFWVAGFGHTPEGMLPQTHDPGQQEITGRGERGLGISLVSRRIGSH